MLKSFIDYFIGYRKLTCDKVYAARIADIMMKNEIRYRDFKTCDSGISFIINSFQHRKLTGILESEEIPIAVLWEKGLPFVIKRYRKRPGILVGALIIMLLTKLSTMYVWDVSVEGNENISDAEILFALEELGFSVGSYIPGVDFYGICYELLLANDDLSWVSVNMEGTGAKVKIRENDKKGTPEDGNGTPSNIVARFDGEIIRTETVSGQLMAKAGDRVKAGQLLISGIVEIGQGESGRFVLTRSSGHIYAKTERIFTVEVPLESVKSVLQKRVTVKKSLKFFGKSIKLKENSSILTDSCDIITVNKRIVLFEGLGEAVSVPLPMSVITQYVDIYADEKVSYTEDEALAVAEKRMSEIVISELEGAEILKKDVTCSLIENVLTLRWSITCIQDIGTEAPIGLI